MQTLYFENRSIKEKIFFDMINLVKVFSVIVVVLSIVLVTIQVCETAKRDFKLKNIFRFMDDKRIKKPKKDFKHLKDFKVHYVEGKDQDKLIPSESQQRIHTLMPLPLPVHLPIPTYPNDHFIENHAHPPPPQAFPHLHQVHFPFHHNADYHDHHHHHLEHHHHHHEPQLHSHQLAPEESNSIISPLPPPLPPPIIIHQEFNPIPLPFVSDPIEDRISYPVFELMEESFKPIKNKRGYPNAHSYGDTNDSIRTNLEDDSKYDVKNRMNDNKQRISKENKSSQTSVKLVNNKKFNTIHKINTNLDNIFDEGSSHSHKMIKPYDNSRNSDERYSNNRQRITNQDNKLKPSDNKIDEKVYSPEAIPDEQVINVVEDEWTFKDLDLWIIR